MPDVNSCIIRGTAENFEKLIAQAENEGAIRGIHREKYELVMANIDEAGLDRLRALGAEVFEDIVFQTMELPYRNSGRRGPSI